MSPRFRSTLKRAEYQAFQAGCNKEGRNLVRDEDQLQTFNLPAEEEHDRQTLNQLSPTHLYSAAGRPAMEAFSASRPYDIIQEVGKAPGSMGEFKGANTKPPSHITSNRYLRPSSG